MSQSTSQSPRQDRSKKTKQQLLDAFERLLESKTINELTVSEIAREANLTTGAIYRRFKDKQDLLNEAFNRFLEETTARTEDELKGFLESGDLEDSQIVQFVVRKTLFYTLDHIALMRAATTFKDTLPYDRMREARNIFADWLSLQITKSPLSGEELKERTRFGMRTITAVIRDTYMAGPGMKVNNSKSAQRGNNKKLTEKLIADLSLLLSEYLKLP